MAVVWAVGDGATGGTDAAAVAKMIAADKPDAFLWLGDVYESGTADEFQANYQPSWGTLDPVAHPIPGNHDWPNYPSGYKPYFDRAGRPSDPFYVFDLDGWRCIMLNSEQPMDPASDQYRWAETQGAPGRKNVACWHRPRYCSGSHGDAADTDPLWQLLAPHCALILGGHAHNMQHFKPDATGCSQLVSGAGGRALYAEIPGDGRLEWGKSDGYGAVRLELGARIDVKWISEQGTVVYETAV